MNLTEYCQVCVDILILKNIACGAKREATMPYCIDLERIVIGEYRELLKQQRLLPGRRILLQDIDRNFAALAAQRIDTVAQLRQRLSSPQKIGELSAVTGIPQDYLAILKRELGSLDQKPLPLSSFPGIDPELIAALAAEGVHTSKDRWEYGAAEPDELYCLCDLVRINGVGAAAAKAFYAAGYRCVRDVSLADAAGMLERVLQANEMGRYYQAKLGEKDMQFCIDAAQLILRFSR